MLEGISGLYGEICLALVAVNLWTVLCFWQDKSHAVTGRRRIAESSLLGLALIGGTPGALVARRVFRHKTRKQPFSGYLHLIAVVQLGVLVGLLMPLAV